MSFDIPQNFKCRYATRSAGDPSARGYISGISNRPKTYVVVDMADFAEYFSLMTRPETSFAATTAVNGFTQESLLSKKPVSLLCLREHLITLTSEIVLNLQKSVCRAVRRSKSSNVCSTKRSQNVSSSGKLEFSINKSRGLAKVLGTIVRAEIRVP